MSAYSNAVLALNPNSYWRFSGASGLTDSGSAGITLTSVGAPIRGRSLVPSENAVEDASFKLDGTQYFTAGDNYEFTGEVNWTLMWWMRVESDTFGTGFQRILEKRDTGGTNQGWLIYGGGAPGQLQFDLDFGATVEGLGTAASLDRNEVHFVSYTWTDATTDLKVYVDGVEIDDKASWTTAPGFPASGTTPLTIGAAGNGTANLIAFIDDIAVWSGTALTATQIRNLFAAGSYQPRPVMSSRGTSW